MRCAGVAVADPEDLTEAEASSVASKAPSTERAVADGLASAFGAVGRRIAIENAREVVDFGPTPLVGRSYEAMLGRHSGAPRWDQLPLALRRRALAQAASLTASRLQSACGPQVAAAVLAGVRAIEASPDAPSGTGSPQALDTGSQTT